MHIVFKTNLKTLYVFDVIVNFDAIVIIYVCCWYKEIQLICVIFNLNYSAFWNSLVCLVHFNRDTLGLFMYMNIFSAERIHITSLFPISIFLFLAALGLRCWAWAFSSWSGRGLLFIAVCGLLIAVVFLVAEHRL